MSIPSVWKPCSVLMLTFSEVLCTSCKKFTEIAPVVDTQPAESMHLQRSDPQRDNNFAFSCVTGVSQALCWCQRGEIFPNVVLSQVLVDLCKCLQRGIDGPLPFSLFALDACDPSFLRPKRIQQNHVKS